MRVLVIGGTGFIGQATVRGLLREGAEVVVLARRPPSMPLAGVTYIQGSYGQRDPLMRAVQDVSCVIHAALRVPARIVDLSRDLATTAIHDFEHMLGWLQGLPKSPRMVYVSSAVVYGSLTGVADESEPLAAPQNKYALTVHGIERALEAAKAQGLSAISLRCFNAYGLQEPRPGGFLNFPQRALTAALTGIPLTIYGDGSTERDFIYITDIARANLIAAKSGATGVVNICSGEATSLNHILRQIETFSGRPVPVRYDEPVFAGAPHSQGATHKAQTLLGFSCATSLDEGLAQLCEEASAQHGQLVASLSL